MNPHPPLPLSLCFISSVCCWLAAVAAFVQHLSQVLYVDPGGKIHLNCEYCFQEGVEDLSSLINTIMNCVQCIQSCTYY